jgi:chromosome segregation ATPase
LDTIKVELGSSRKELATIKQRELAATAAVTTMKKDVGTMAKDHAELRERHDKTLRSLAAAEEKIAATEQEVDSATAMYMAAEQAAEETAAQLRGDLAATQQRLDELQQQQVAAVGEYVIKCPLSSARAQSQLLPRYISLGTCRWR